MGRFRWPLVVFLICLPVAVLATGFELPWLAASGQLVRPLPVPDDDQEIVWLHTTTNAGTWERFVAGVQRAAAAAPQVTVDFSHAFSQRSTAVPELVIGSGAHRGRLRIRWYKISSYAKTAHWVQELARRDPAPLAIIGGGSSDRARDLAFALARQTGWHGDPPALLLTTATAEKVEPEAETGGEPVLLTTIYSGRTFRFCFGDRQMTEAMLDFVSARPELRPQLSSATASHAAASSLAAAAASFKPTTHYVEWSDDPYSSDLLDQLKDVIPRTFPGGPNLSGWKVPFSVGGYYLPNRVEAEAADGILRELRRIPPQRSLLVIPTVPAPARRLIRTLCDADPLIGQRVVALNGDGIQVNTVLRDGEFAWPVYALTMPVVLFSHNDPIGWDEAEERRELRVHRTWPSSTEDVLHFAELVRVLIESAFHPDDSGPLARADELVARLRGRKPAYFDPTGSRLGGKGEYVLLFKPTNPGPNGGGLPDAMLEVWKRSDPDGWEMTRSLPVHQSRVGGRDE